MLAPACDGAQPRPESSLRKLHAFELDHLRHAHRPWHSATPPRSPRNWRQTPCETTARACGGGCHAAGTRDGSGHGDRIGLGSGIGSLSQLHRHGIVSNNPVNRLSLFGFVICTVNKYCVSELEKSDTSSSLDSSATLNFAIIRRES